MKKDRTWTTITIPRKLAEELALIALDEDRTRQTQIGHWVREYNKKKHDNK